MKQISLWQSPYYRMAMMPSFAFEWLNVRMLSLLLIAVCVFANDAAAQTVTMPKVDIDGVDSDSSGSEILVVVFKWGARLVIWAIMGWAGIVCLKTILASWQEQKSKEAGRWGAVMADSFGSVIMVMVVIAIGLWVLSFIK